MASGAVLQSATVWAASGRDEMLGLSLPAQDLGAALRRFSVQAHKQIIFSEEIVRGLKSTPLHGRYTEEEALKQILADTGLVFVKTASGVLMVRSADQVAIEEPTGARDVLGDYQSPPWPPVTAGNSRYVDEMTVTATRVLRDGFSAPTATQVLTSQQLEVRGASNIGNILNEMPAFRATVNPQSNGVRSITPGAVFADLRGLGASRTLVLVDGNRFVPQIYTGLPGYQIDMNQIPSLLVDRVEVVTGGASAQWGSDAVAGVANIILRKHFDGFNFEVQRGVSDVGDNKSIRVGAIAGTNFADDRGNFVFGVDYDKNTGVGDVFTRDWGRDGWQITTNPGFPDNGAPRQIISPDVRFASTAPGGLLINTSLRGTTFDEDGQPIPFVYGDYVGSGFTGSMVGGGSNEGINVNTGLSIRPESRRRNFYSHVNYVFSDRVSGYAEGSYAYMSGAGQTLPARDFDIPIFTDNPYLPDSVRRYMLDNGIDQVLMGRADYDMGQQQSSAKNRTKRFVAGLEGAFGEGWNWDAAVTYGRNSYVQRVYGNRNRTNFALAQDPVYDAGSGRIVCRSTLIDPDNGCVPLNLFGPNAITAEAAAYATGTTMTNTLYEQTAANFNISGEPFSSWAGPVSLAAGVEYRDESQDTVVDPIAEMSQWESTNAQPLTGSFHVLEGYVETVVPLASDTTLAKSLDLNGAVRVAEYSTAAGTQPTWKLGLTWEPTDFLMVRAARSRDIRAPNIFEINTPGVTTRVNVVYGSVATLLRQIIIGNANLQPEKADTWTLGAVLQPPMVENLRMSVDYYKINLDGAITAPAVATVADGCFEGEAFYCQFITFDGDGVPTTVATPFLNLDTLKRTGLDVEIAYYTILPGIGGNLGLSASANWMFTYGTDVGNGLDDTAGEIFGMPVFRATISASYVFGPAMLNAQVRYIGSSKYDKNYVEGVDINDNSVPDVAYLNLSGAYDVTEQIQVFAVIDNALDKDPPIEPSVFGYPTQPAFFDMIGRSFKIGVRGRF